jgi:hypothetical protein
MARDVQTKVTIGAETKGFVKVAQEAAKVSKAAAVAAKDQLKNAKDVEKELDRMGSQLKDLARLQVSLNKQMEKVDKTSGTYKELAGRMKDVTKQQDDLQRAARNVERAFQDQGKAVTAAQMAQGGFAQGLLQGVTPGVGPFLQRGPGMRRQAIGMGVGRMARGLAGGAARAPFAGMQGIAQALSAMPGGGLLAGPMMLAAAQAGPALAYRGAMQQAMPFLGTGATREAAAGVRARLSPERIRRLAERRATTEIGYEERYTTVGEGPTIYEERFAHTVDEQLRTAETKRLEATRARRIGEVTADRRRFFGTITGAGAGLAGMAKPEAMQFAAQIAQIGGGRAIDMPKDFFRTAFAARTLYGVGPEATGAFMQAGRRGGLVGGAGRGGEALAETIGQATAIGLEGSEINDFLSVIAGGIQDWKRTGIQINAGAITGIARGVGAAVGAVRGMAIARGMQAAATGMSARGPQTTLDLMMMQAAGYRGGGAGEFEAAQIAIEKGLTSDQWNVILKRLIRQGGGAETGRLYAATMFRQAGITMPASEMAKLAQEGIGEVPGAPKAKVTGAELIERAPKALDPFLVRQAAITNKQLAAGQKMLTATQNTADSAANTAAVFVEKLGPTIDALTGKLNDLTMAVSGTTEAVKKSKEGGWFSEYGSAAASGSFGEYGSFTTGEEG